MLYKPPSPPTDRIAVPVDRECSFQSVGFLQRLRMVSRLKNQNHEGKQDCSCPDHFADRAYCFPSHIDLPFQMMGG